MNFLSLDCRRFSVLYLWETNSRWIIFEDCLKVVWWLAQGKLNKKWDLILTKRELSHILSVNFYCVFLVNISQTSLRIGLLYGISGLESGGSGDWDKHRGYNVFYVFCVFSGWKSLTLWKVFYCCPINSIKYKNVVLGHCVFSGRVLFCNSKPRQKIDNW